MHPKRRTSDADLSYPLSYVLQRLAKLMKEADPEVFAHNPINLFTSMFTKRRRERLYKAIFKIFDEVCRLPPCALLRLLCCLSLLSKCGPLFDTTRLPLTTLAIDD